MKPLPTKTAPDRLVEPEWLDELPANAPEARQARRDLVRINWFMRNPALLARGLRRIAPAHPWRLIELGAGDGALTLSTVRRLRPQFRPGKATLVDRVPAASNALKKNLSALGCELEVVQADVFDWLGEACPAGCVITANLFLHHFSEDRLQLLLESIHLRAAAFLACEPERSTVAARFCSPLLRLIGCNEITRHDGVISVRAGFAGQELSKLWPNDSGWQIEEHPAGLFSHFFSAHRVKQP